MAANNILELKLHVDYCETFGISEQQVQATEEHRGKPIILTACQRRNTNAIAACTAYTRYCLDVGQSEDWFALQMALAPCLLGYGAVAKMLHAHPATKRDESNVYWPWIQNYVADDYLEAVRHGSGRPFCFCTPDLRYVSSLRERITNWDPRRRVIGKAFSIAITESNRGARQDIHTGYECMFQCLPCLPPLTDLGEIICRWKLASGTCFLTNKLVT